MKKIISFSLLCFVFVSCFSQAKITEMPTYVGNPSGGYIPIVLGGVNRKIDAVLLGYDKIDSIIVSGTDLLSYKNGIVVRTQALPGGGAVFAYTPENVANKNVSNGYAGLDNAGKLPITVMPTGALVYKGVWDASSNTPALANGTGTNGAQYNVSVGGTRNLGAGNITFLQGDQVIYNGTTWERNPSGNNVTLVNQLSGDVRLTSDNVPEGASGVKLYTSPTEKATWNAKAGTASPTFSGIVNVPTPLTGTRNGQAASTNFVGNELQALPGLNIVTSKTGYKLVRPLTDTSVRFKSIVVNNTAGNPQLSIDSTTTDSTLIFSITGGGTGGGTTTTPATTNDTLLLTGTGFMHPLALNSAYYMGGYNLSTPTQSSGVLRIYVPHGGRIAAANLFYTMITGTTGSSTELTKFTVMVNGAAVQDIANVNWGSTREGRIYNGALNVPVVLGDYVEIKMLIPAAYATLPTQARFSFWLLLTR